MSKFVTKRITVVEGRQEFRQLIIVSDDVDIERLQTQIDDEEMNNREVETPGQLDLYEDGLEKIYESSFARIVGNMNRVANGVSVPKEKFKDVTERKSLVTEYEYKYGDLRGWAIKIPNGQLFILGGYKNNQKKGFREFRSLVEQYLNQ